MKVIKLSLVLLVILFLMNLALASFEVGNVSDNLQSVYGANKPISGWVNLSFSNESADSVLSAFDSSVNLLDLLKNNSVSPDCVPLDCSMTYSKVGSVANSKNFSINFAGKKTIGIKITKEIDEIKNLSFDVSTDAGASCVSPLQIDILDDDLIEWKYENTTDSYCNSEKPFGCFDSTSIKEIGVDEKNFCERIVVPPTKAIKIGAILRAIESVPESADFQLTLDIDGEPCVESISESGEVSCIISLEEALIGLTEVEVCIKAESGSENKYKIGYDNYVESTCGFKKDLEGDEEPFDFEIFAKPLRYSPISEDFEFNQNLIGEELESSINLGIVDYIHEKYNNCTNGCIIPITFLSGINQEITISNFDLSYLEIGDLSNNFITDFYELESAPALLTSDFEKLELEKANLLAPSTLGKKTLYLKLNDEKILEKEITVKLMPEIVDVFPTSVASLVPTTFIANLENVTGNLTYYWNFGDNSSEQISNNNFIKHTYSNIGSYDLTLKVKGSFGESLKTFNMEVVAPSEAINQTLIDYRLNLKNLKKQINELPLMIKTEIEKVVDLIYLEKELDKKEDNYKDALGDDEFVEIMKELLIMKVPEEIGLGFVIENGKFFQNPDEIKLDNFEVLDAGIVDGESEDYINALNNWIRANLDINFESKNYVLNYKNLPSESLFTYMKLNLKPINDIEYLYVVINGNPAKIKFSLDFKDKDIEEFARAIIFDELIADENTVVEIIHPNAISIDNFPVYLSPDFNELELSFDLSACNNNGKCESGESSKNCKNDCKPWKFVIVLLVILLGIAFVVYIVLQEWYKRKYESHLFKDKNQLFNLINFISVSESKNVSKNGIFSGLKGQGWKNEQIVYAWKKFKGKRTGMWEIPIFSVFEKKKLKKELAKRKGFGRSPAVKNVGGRKGFGVSNEKVKKKNSFGNNNRNSRKKF
jgi:PKD repeat protein